MQSGNVGPAALGTNNAANGFDSSLVVANPDGTVLERLEKIQQTQADTEPVSFTPSTLGDIDEDGGRAAIAVSIVDRNTGQVASGSIDITGITYELAKSTAGGAFSTVGITQPTGATKANGLVELEFDVLAAEWAVGDTYRLKVGAVTATVGTTTYHTGTLTWAGTIVENLDVKTVVDDVDADLGEPTDAATATPFGTAGTAMSRLRGLGDDTQYIADTALATPTIDSLADQLFVAAGTPLRTFLAKPGGTDLAASKSLIDAIGNEGDAPLPLADNATAAGASSLQATIGRKDDTSLGLSAAATSTDTLARHLKGAFDRTRMPSAADNVVAAGSASLGETLGRKDDAAVYVKGVTATEMAYLKAVLDAFGLTKGTITSAAGNASFADTSLATYSTNYFRYATLLFLSGVNAGQGKVLASFTTGTGAMTTSNSFSMTPNVGDQFVILGLPQGTTNELITPSADSTSGTWMREAVGAKADTALTTVGTTASLMRYVKGLLSAGFTAVPATDSANNVGVGDATGSKADAAVYAPTATASLIAYAKALVATGIGKQSTCTSTGTTTQLNDTARTEGNSHWRGHLVIFLTGTLAGQARICTSFVSPALTFTGNTNGWTSAPQSGDSYALIPSPAAVLLVPSADATNNALTSDVVGNKGDGAAYAKSTTASLVAYAKGLLDANVSKSGSCTSVGTTTTVIDSARTEASNYWVGQYLQFLTGPNAGQARLITSWTQGTNTYLFAGYHNPWTSAPQIGDIYIIRSENGRPFLAPLADATNDTLASDVGGRKTDAAAVVASNSKSTLAYGKGAVTILGDPTADALPTITAKLGDNDDAATDPSAASGNVLSKLRGVGDNLDTIIAATDELEADVDKLSDSPLTNSETANSAYYKLANLWESEPATTLNDVSVGSGATENALDKGADTGTPRYRLDGALLNVTTLGSNTTVTFTVQAEINGTLTTLGTEVRSATGAFDLTSITSLRGIAARHLRITYVGNNAANDGAVTGTILTSKAGI